MATPNVAVDNMSSPVATDNLGTLGERAHAYDNIIYIKTTENPDAATMLRSFVEHTLNEEHGTAMFCIEVKQRKYPTLFPLKMMHDDAPSRHDLLELFSPFGKCSFRSKDSKTTYINFKQFEQVEAVLAAMNSSQLKFQHMVIRDGLYAVQNTKLMMSFDNTFHDEHESIRIHNCITKEVISKWFFEVKQKAAYEKTWEQLVDLLEDRIAKRFDMTYDKESEIFCKNVYNPLCETSAKKAPTMAGDPENTAAKDDNENTAANGNNPNGDIKGVQAVDEMQDNSAAAVETGGRLQVGEDGNGDIIAYDATCEVVNHAIFHAGGTWGGAMNLSTGNSMHAVDGSDFMPESGDMYENQYPVVHRMNCIPLYGDESHPLHQRLCGFERQLFGKCEESNVNIHYRLMNMEMMMNINGENQPLAVRLVDLACWIQQYIQCMEQEVHVIEPAPNA